MQQTRFQHQPSPGDNPQKSLRDEVIKLVLDAILIAQFFGLTGDHVTNAIVNVITWLFHQGMWLYHLIAPVIYQFLNELLRSVN